MVYLLHLMDGKGNTAGLERSNGVMATHYLGYTPDERRGSANSRIQKHMKGVGARFTQVWHERGGSFTVAAWYPGGDRALERALKNQRNHKRLCPICRAEAEAARRAKAGEADPLDLL